MTILAEAPTLAAAAPGRLAVAGVFDDMPMAEYHRDPVPGGSLSSSGARKLLDPSCPAKFHYELTHPPAPTDAMEFGTAVHTMVLGSGPRPVAIKFDSWRGQAAKVERLAVRGRGDIPLLQRDYDRAQAMAKVVREDPVASALFSPLRGKTEQTLIWQDEQTGVWCRARPDWFGVLGSGRPALSDYKTCAAGDLESLRKAVQQYGYHMQRDWYVAGVKALGLAEDPEFFFVFQEKDPPHLITITSIEAISQQIAAAKNRRAITTFAKCRATGHWPAYIKEPVALELPGWAESRDGQEYLSDIK